MISEKRLAANRANAQRSTGPRTTDGKAASRQNSLKHGLTGEGIVLPDEIAGDVAAKEKCFADCAQPGNAIEHELIHRMAVASVRMAHTESTDDARRGSRRKRVAKRFERTLASSVRLGISLLAENPAEARNELEATSAGCHWLVAEWKELEQTITSHGYWTEDHLAHAMALLGLDPREPHANLEIAMRLRLSYLAFLPTVDLDAADRLLAIDTSKLSPEARRREYAEMIPSAEQSRQVLRAFVLTEIAALEERRAQIESRIESPELAGLMRAVDIDSSPEGLRLARYDAMNELAFHRNWTAFQRLRKHGPESLGLVAEAQAQNEPTEELTSRFAKQTYELSQKLIRACAEASERKAAEVRQPAQASPPHFEPAEVAPEVGPGIALSA